MNNVSVTRPYRKRRRHAPEFKARLVAECQNPGASVSRIVLDNDLNANQLRRWIRESIMAILKQHKAGVPVAELSREHNVSSAPICQCRSKFGGMDASMMKRLKELKAENAA